MAFFGLTNLGYQDPIGDNLLVNPKKVCQDGRITVQATLPPSSQVQRPTSLHKQRLPQSTDIHRGSRKRYSEMVRMVQTPTSPNQLYMKPVTDSMQYGWRVSQTIEPWMQIKRFPKKNSEMTKFVEEMVLADRAFSLCTV
ncbi:sperm microtubule inner protein 11 [Nelusetta ayraudi]|uniref:sperm microtubule inner protein 11 n=1 Tax=Nelusetta ayraudi TaxID=303726 RepID=UPI003F6EF869